MRAYIKKKLCELINSLYKAHEEITTLSLATDINQIMDILTECQQAAIAIGENIENTEEDTTAVSLLESYCDDLYELSLHISNRSEVKKRLKWLSHILKKVEDYLNHQIILTYEIVFLPYKASMWDSMESIWMEFIKDSHFNTHVIPIPYYEKKAKSIDQQLCYEGDLLPTNVIIEDYQKVNLEVIHPDVIIFHNPYDQFNKVTSVHPAFYSAKLKEYTDMLIYTPYYVAEGRIPEAHLMFPSYIHADKIIVQGQQAYDQLKETISADKLLMFGSPKIDCVLNYENNKDKLKIPKTWNSIINNRKVILYNTSITSLLQYGEVALDKIEMVLKEFQDRKDVVIWWRPHPLYRSTLIAMKPELVQRYDIIQQDFIANKMGILDTGADLNLAIAISDAYIGEDTSSMATLFDVTKKPMFLLDNKINNYQQLRTSPIYDMYCDKQSKWFIIDEFKVIAKCNFSDRTVEIVKQIPEELYSYSGSYCRFFKREQRIILIPFREDKILEYNLDDDEFTYEKVENSKDNGNFFTAVYYDNALYLAPHCYQGIVRYDLKNRECSYYCDELLNDSNSKYGIGRQYNNKLYFASMESNRMVEFNMDTKSITIHTLSEENRGFYWMDTDGEFFWLIDIDRDNIFRWDCLKNELKHIKLSIKQKIEGLIAGNDYVLLFPELSDDYKLYKLDKKNGSLDMFAHSMKINIESRNEILLSYSYLAKINDYTVLAYRLTDAALLEIDLEKQKYEIIKLELNNIKQLVQDKNFINGIKFNSIHRNMYHESQAFRVGSFVDAISADSIIKEDSHLDIVNDGISCGKKVYDYIKRNI